MLPGIAASSRLAGGKIASAEPTILDWTGHQAGQVGLERCVRGGGNSVPSLAERRNRRREAVTRLRRRACGRAAILDMGLAGGIPHRASCSPSTVRS